MVAIGFEHVSKRFRDGTEAVKAFDLEIADGELMVLVGPSGSGKSTILRMVAGLERPTSGTVWIGGREANELSPGARDLAMVFQDYALYPHMTVARNLAFALESRKLRRSEIDRRVGETAALLGIGSLLARRPAALSGGERQRVAMGRAIVRKPAAFLMDEPLSNLDAQLRAQVRTEIRRLHRELGATFVYVTHDQVEAMTMGDRIAVLRRGELQQVAAGQTLYEAPANAFVAAFIGSPPAVLVSAPMEAAGGVRARIGPWTVCLPDNLRIGGDRAGVGLRPEAFIEPGGPTVTGAARPSAPVRVIDAEPLGAVTNVSFQVDIEPVTI
nr:ABC transporter ATP-binding protein [Chloroflexota bacterium]